MIRIILRRALLAWWMIGILTPMLIGLDFLLMKEFKWDQSKKDAFDFANMLWKGVEHGN